MSMTEHGVHARETREPILADSPDRVKREGQSLASVRNAHSDSPSSAPTGRGVGVGVNLQDPFSIHSKMAGLVKELKVTTQIDGEKAKGPISYREFCEMNSELKDELCRISEALDRNGVYQGGGGGARIFTVRIALESALDLFNTAFDYGFMLPMEERDLEAAIDLARLHGREDIASQLISAIAGSSAKHGRAA